MTTLPDFDRARALMVDGQLRPSKVVDRRILDAMRRLPRERFLPASVSGLAYLDTEIPLPGGRAMPSPLLLARLLQLAAPRSGERALVVGAGSGYGAAVLAATGVAVLALDSDSALLALARAACAEFAPGVRFLAGPLAAGAPGDAPFDLVVIEGAVRAIPEALGRQVAANGRLVTVVAPERGVAYAALAEPSAGSLRARPAFDAAAPLLAELLPAHAFVF